MFWDAYACARRGYERNASESCQDNDIDEWCQTDPRWESIRSFRQVGSTIQVIYVENEGEDVRPLAKSNTDREDKLTDDFGDRLASRSI